MPSDLLSGPVCRTGVWVDGLFSEDDPRIILTMEAMRNTLWVQNKVGGMARYENDYYHQVSTDTGQIPGNPWFICTLWLAEWYIATATAKEELQPALQLLEWVAEHTLASGVMAEQVHPHAGSPLSVSPLTWSHATYVSAILNYNTKLSELTTDEH